MDYTCNFSKLSLAQTAEKLVVKCNNEYDPHIVITSVSKQQQYFAYPASRGFSLEAIKTDKPQE